MAIVKLAFVDADTGEYYVKETPSKLEFSSDIDDAKVYVCRSEVKDYFDYVSLHSKRNLKVVEVEISNRLIGDSDFLVLDKNKKETMFKKLLLMAIADIDAMSEKDYTMYKKLKRELSL